MKIWTWKSMYKPCSDKKKPCVKFILLALTLIRKYDIHIFVMGCTRSVDIDASHGAIDNFVKITFPLQWLSMHWVSVPQCIVGVPWWRHQMEAFSALLAICAGTGEFPTQRPVTRSFHIFFDLRLNKRLSKQWWGWWFETLPRPLWRHRNDISLVLSLLYLNQFVKISSCLGFTFVLVNFLVPFY